MDEALARIRSFSAITWTVGSLVVMIVAFLTVPAVFTNPRTGEVIVGGVGGDVDDRPWLVRDAQEYTVVDGVLHGTRQGGYLRLPGGSNLVMITSRGDINVANGVAIYQQVGTQRDTNADHWEYPGYLGSMYGGNSQTLVMPADRDGLLWFSASQSDWTADVTVPETKPMGQTASGSGDAVLIYDGDALSGRFQHFGSGLMLVSLVGVAEWDSLVSDFDDVDVRASWKPSDRIAFFVEAGTGRGTWTITLDTPASGAPPSGTAPPASTPSSPESP